MNRRARALLILTFLIAFNMFVAIEGLTPSRLGSSPAVLSNSQSLSSSAGNQKSPLGVNKSRHITITNNLSVARLNEPVNINLTFSQGEAYNNSLRLYDPEGRESPYQVKDALYYSGSRYYSRCSLAFPVNIAANSGANYSLTYSTQDIGVPDFRKWSDLNISGDGLHQNITVWNSFYRAVILANSSQGISQFHYLPMGQNRSLVWGGWSLIGFSFNVNESLYGVRDLENSSVRVLHKGPVFIEIVINGSREGLYVECHLEFFAHLPSVYAKMIFENRGAKLSWYYPLHVLYTKDLFSRYLLSDGTDDVIASTGWGKSFSTQKWWTLYDPASGGVCNMQIPTDKISRVIVGGDFPDFDVALNKGEGKYLDEKGERVQFLTKIFPYVRVENETLTFEYEKFVKPLIALPQTVVATIRVSSPREVEIDTKFFVTAEIIALTNCTNPSISLSFLKDTFMIDRNQTTQYVGNLTFGQTKSVSWNLTAKQEGEYTLTADFKCQEGRAAGETPITVYLSSVTPLVSVTFRTVDADGERGLGNLNITLQDSRGKIYRSAISNGTGYADLKIGMGNYYVKVYSGPRLVGYKTALITASVSMLIKCWAYDVNVLLLNRDGKPLPGMAVSLKSMADTTKKEASAVVFAGQSRADGVARIENVWNDTYSLTVFGIGAKLANATVNIQGDERNETLICNVADLLVHVKTPDGQPIFNVTARLYGEEKIISTEFSDAAGNIRFRNLLLGNYTLFLSWMKADIGSVRIALFDGSKEIIVEGDISRLTIMCIDIWGKPLAGADVAIQSGREIYKYKANESGYVSEIVPAGRPYRVSVYSGIYSGAVDITVTESSVITVVCNIKYTIAIYLGVLSAAWAGVGWFFRRQRREVSFELIRCKDRISRLEELYGRGEVEYPLYTKIKKEYEEELRKLREQGIE